MCPSYREVPCPARAYDTSVTRRFRQRYAEFDLPTDGEYTADDSGAMTRATAPDEDGVRERADPDPGPVGVVGAGAGAGGSASAVRIYCDSTSRDGPRRRTYGMLQGPYRGRSQIGA